MKRIWIVLFVFFTVRFASGAAAANIAPILQNGATDYAIVNQFLPTGSTLHKLLVTDPDNGTLTYSIIGVKYFKNDTEAPVSVSNSSWALFSTPKYGSPLQCQLAVRYPFPRNLFCIEPNDSSLKTTQKYSETTKADFSLFAVTVLVIDNGSPQLNLTTDVYLRVMENCTDSSQSYSILMQHCPQAREIIKHTSSRGEIGFLFTVPNNTKIARVDVEFHAFYPFKAIGQLVDYRFTYAMGRLEKHFNFQRWLLVNTTFDRKISMFLSKPIDIIGDTGNVSLALTVKSGRNDLIRGDGHKIELYLLDRSRNYCKDDKCVRLYNDLASAMSAIGKPECIRQDQFVVQTKYSSCNVSNKAPIWVNISSYVTMKRSPGVGAAVYDIGIKDAARQKLLFSIIGVTYYASAVSAPQKAYDEKWAVKSHFQSNDSSCKLAESLPWPRNLFCIEHGHNVVKTTGMVENLRPRYDAIFVIDFIVFDNGKPQLNTTGRIHVTIQFDCQLNFGARRCACANGVQSLDWQSKANDSSAQRTGLLKYSAKNFRFWTLQLNMTHFNITNVERVVRIRTTISTANASKALLQRQQYALHNGVTYVHLGLLVDGEFTLKFEIVNHGSAKTLTALNNTSSFRIYGLSQHDHCGNDFCRDCYKAIRSDLKRNHRLQCLDFDVKYLMNAKFKSCGIVIRRNSSGIMPVDRPKNGTAFIGVKALANNDVFYSITSVGVWKSDVEPGISVRNESWKITSKSDADRDCWLSERYPFPRNLFCINSTGFVLGTARLVDKYGRNVLFNVEVTAVDSENSNNTAKIQQYFSPNLGRNKCAMHSKTLISFSDTCDSSTNSANYATKSVLSVFHFKAPPVKSLVGQFAVLSTLITKSFVGSLLKFTVIRNNKANRTIKNYVLVPPSPLSQSAYFHNVSLYDRPIELAPLEQFRIKIEADFPLVFNDSLPQQLAMYSTQAKDYCFTPCYELYSNITRTFPEWHPFFPCLGTFDYKLYNAKYGYCSANTPPILSISDIELTAAPVIGATIGRVVGVDKEKTVLTYTIIWVFSRALGKNATQTSGFPGRSCSEAGKNIAPLSYICVDHNTGEIKATSHFKHTYGESLSVGVGVVDNGSPRRISTKTFKISIKDPCKSVRLYYQNLTTTCTTTINRPMTSSENSEKIYYSKRGDSAVLLHVDTNIMRFPADTLHTIFTLRQVITRRANVTYGKQVAAVFNNTAFRLRNISQVRIPLNLSLQGAMGAELSAISYVKTSNLSRTTKLSPRPPSKPSLTSGRDRRQTLVSDSVEAFAASESQTSAKITLQGSGLKLIVIELRKTCGSTECVKKYQTWVNESKRNGLKICSEDPSFVRHFFEICLRPPSFDSHPHNISVTLKSAFKIHCGYQNFTTSTFSWLKDGEPFTPPAVVPDSYGEFDEIDGFSGGPTTKSLLIKGDSPELQGYYSCMVKDALNHVVNSSASLVRFKDVSSNRMGVKINQPFANALKNKTSPQYQKLSKDVLTALHAIFDKKAMHKQRKIVVKGFRPGSVIADVDVYYLNVSTERRRTICSQLKTISARDSASRLDISSVETVSYDCCYRSQTGEEAIKGVIHWRPVVADAFDVQKCPYGFYSAASSETIFNNAQRFCMVNFKDGATWQSPNISECAYKTLTTYKLENISQTNISDSNAEQVASDLSHITSSKGNITNRLDVKFTADSVENLVRSKRKLSKIVKDIVNTTSNMMDFNETYVAESQLQYKSSSRVLQSLDKLAIEIKISQNSSVSTVTKNVALSIKPISSTENEVAISAKRSKRSGFNEISIQNSPSGQMSNRNSAEILLSRAMLRKAVSLDPKSFNRIYSFAFESDVLFLSKNRIEANWRIQGKSANTSQMINSRILSASIGDISLQNLTADEEMRGSFKIRQDTPGELQCVFWDFQFADGFGAWSSNGCRTDGYENSVQKCRCSHLTNFAILLDVTGEGTPKEAALALSIVTYIGCAISLICLLITLITFGVFRNLREKRPQRILVCLCVALILTLVVFLAGIRAKDLKGCQTVAVLIHYFVLASFAWMAVEGFNLYLSFVKVVNTGITRFMLKSSLFAWGVPAIIVAISAGATELEAYAKKNGDDEWLCMVNGTAFYVAYLVPILLVVFKNLIVMTFVIRSLRMSSKVSKDKKMSGMTMARITAACSVLMGTTWVVGLFAVDVLTVPMQVIFCVLNSLQGFFIFIFYCVRNNDARKQWRKALGIKETSASKSSTSEFRKERVKQKSTESRKGLVITSNSYELVNKNNRSSTLTTSVQDSSTDDQIVSLKSFARIETIKSMPIDREEHNGLKSIDAFNQIEEEEDNDPKSTNSFKPREDEQDKGLKSTDNVPPIVGLAPIRIEFHLPTDEEKQDSTIYKNELSSFKDNKS